MQCHHELMRQQQWRGLRLIEEIARDSAEQQFPHPAVTEGTQRNQFGLQTQGRSQQRLFDRIAAFELVQLGLDAVAREIAECLR